MHTHGKAIDDGQWLEDRYEVLEPLTEGAQAETLLARDRESQRSVVVKRLRLQTARDWKSLQTRVGLLGRTTQRIDTSAEHIQ